MLGTPVLATPVDPKRTGSTGVASAGPSIDVVTIEDPHLSEALRREVEAMRKKALVGQLTEREFRALQSSGRKREVTLRGLFARLRSLRRLAARVPQCPAPLIAGLDSAIRAAEAALGAARHVAGL